MTAPSRRGLSVAVALLLAGGALALLATSQTWLTATVRRAPPLPDVVADLHGGTVQPPAVGIGVVALAAAVAVLASAGLARRLVGAVVAVLGIALVWRSASGLHTSNARVLDLVTQHRAGAVLDRADLHVHQVLLWPVLSIVGGVLVLAAGVLTAATGQRWAGLSSRYEAPVRREPGAGATPPTAPAPSPASAVSATAVPRTEEEQERARSRAAAALWSRVDRGDDPTLE